MSNLTFKSFLENIFDDDFDTAAWRAERKARGNIVDTKRVSEKTKLKLYHGFNKNPKTFNYVFEPSKSEQGLLWFTHNMIRGYDPYQYASSKGKYLLTYLLEITKLADIVTYQNGTTERIISDDLSNLAIPTENCRNLIYFDSLIVLPENWFFTYKNEKFIGTNQTLQVNPNMISET
jgi:hypothetical protein